MKAATCINKDGERFMKRYAPNAMELASRDVVSRSEHDRDRRGPRRQRLRLPRPAPPRRRADHRAAARLARARDDLCGVDPIYEPIPVRPGAHYHMGGVETDNDGRTELDGLYAAGEVACVSVHGANRLGGNSLMETITFGRRAGRAAADWALVAHDDRGAGVRRARRRARAGGAARARRAASGRGRSATSSARRCSRTSASSGARSRC